MSEHVEGGSTAELVVRLGSSEFRQAMRDTGITTAVAAERLREAAQHFDLDEFEMLVATFRPKLWKRMRKRPSALSELRARLGGLATRRR